MEPKVAPVKVEAAIVLEGPIQKCPLAAKAATQLQLFPVTAAPQLERPRAVGGQIHVPKPHQSAQPRRTAGAELVVGGGNVYGAAAAHRPFQALPAQLGGNHVVAVDNGPRHLCYWKTSQHHAAAGQLRFPQPVAFLVAENAFEAAALLTVPPKAAHCHVASEGRPPVRRRTKV